MRAKVSQRRKAEEFLSLHHAEPLLILPNAWDVPSARIFEEEGFAAVATSSAALAVSVGYPDGEAIPKQEYFSIVARIAAALTVPLSADIESGFGGSLAQLRDTIRRTVAAGAIGINLEDIADFSNRTLHPIEAQVDRIRAVRKTSESLGVPLVLNARTDALRYAKGDESARLAEAIRRGTAYEDAGADCLYPMGLADRRSIRTFVEAVRSPVNVMARKGLPSVPVLRSLGVKRLSLGPTPMYASMGLLRSISRELKEAGTYRTLLGRAITFDELNALSHPRSD